MLGRCEELLATQDIEVRKPQHVVYCVNLEAMNTVRGLVPGQVFETNTDPSQSSAEGRGLIEAEAGTETNFTVTTRDSMGSQWYDEQDQLTVIICSQKGEEKETKIEDCKNGSHEMRNKPKSVGLRDISVEVSGQPLTGSPWRVNPNPKLTLFFFFFLTALLTITHVTYSKLNSQEKKMKYMCKVI